jgi:GH15 family glucan-1,4-alpha-glucosidase
MSWVAFECAIRSAEKFGLDGPIDQWREARATIHADICEHGFNPKRKSFVQYYGGESLDASLLLIPQVGFLPCDDSRVTGTVAAIERELVRDGFVRRYATEEIDDGVGGHEGTFIVCSFWLADAHVLLGRLDEARDLFERLLSVRNDLGLLAEEYDPVARRQLGNFPQGFSHIGLVNTAFNLLKAAGPAEQRSAQKAPRG